MRQAHCVDTAKNRKSGLIGWLLLLAAMILTGCGQIALHWGLSRGMFPNLLAQYFYRDPYSGKSSGAYLLIAMWPGVLLGGLNGWLGYGRWTQRMMLLNAFVISLLVVDVLTPFRARLLGAQFRESPFAASVGSFLITVFCTYFVYVQRIEREKRRELP